MSWREQWQAGSFRDVEFKWRQSDTVVGRKTARHDYPQRDDAYMEDLGKRPREFSLECFVIGKDYMDDRDALMVALEEAGPGTLIHPTMGMMLVSLNGDVRIAESTSEGGICRFTIPFILAEENKWYLSADTDTAAAVDQRSEGMIEMTEEDFADDFSVEDMPAYVSDAASSMAGTVCDTVNGLSAMFPVGIKTPAFVKSLNKIKTSLTTLAGKPLTLAKAITGQINKLRDIALAPLNLANYTRSQAKVLLNLTQSVAGLPMSLLNAYATLFNYGKSTATAASATPSRVRLAQNSEALAALVRRTAIAEAARTSSTVTFTSYDEAVHVQNILIEAIDTESLTAPDSVYSTLMDLRAAVVMDLSTRGADLSRIIKYTPACTEPALIIAHRLYGDATRADEIIARNKIKNPLFVPGGVPLEVLSD